MQTLNAVIGTGVGRGVSLVVMAMLLVTACMVLWKAARFMPRKVLGAFMVAFLLVFGGLYGMAQGTGTDASAIVSTVNTDFPAVAGACISIGTFFIIYRLVKRVR